MASSPIDWSIFACNRSSRDKVRPARRSTSALGVNAALRKAKRSALCCRNIPMTVRLAHVSAQPETPAANAKASSAAAASLTFGSDRASRHSHRNLATNSAIESNIRMLRREMVILRGCSLRREASAFASDRGDRREGQDRSKPQPAEKHQQRLSRRPESPTPSRILMAKLLDAFPDFASRTDRALRIATASHLVVHGFHESATIRFGFLRESVVMPAVGPGHRRRGPSDRDRGGSGQETIDDAILRLENRLECLRLLSS